MTAQISQMSPTQNYNNLRALSGKGEIIISLLLAYVLRDRSSYMAALANLNTSITLHRNVRWPQIPLFGSKCVAATSH